MATGCKKDEVRVYSIPKESYVTALPEAQTAAPSTTIQLSWIAPKNWIEKPADTIRKGSFEITGPAKTNAQVSIISFPGDAGGMLENINRWRTQVGLEAIPESELSGYVRTKTSNDQTFYIVKMMGEPKGKTSKIAIFAAIVPYQNETWFFKLMGDASLVQNQVPQFEKFLDTVRPRQ